MHWRRQPRVTTHPAGQSTTEPPAGPVNPGPHAHVEDQAHAPLPDVAGPTPGGTGSTTPAVRLEGLEKRYGEVVAVAGIDLEIGDG